LQASLACPVSWRFIRRFPPRPFPSSLPTPRAIPARSTWLLPGVGSSGHLAGELFKLMTGTDLVHVPYRGNGPALTDLLGGQVQVLSPTAISSIEYIRSGKLRALGVTTPARSQTLPDIPAVAEFVPGYEATAWYGIGAPKRTPGEIIARLNKETNAGLADPQSKERLVGLALEPIAMTSAEFATFIGEETAKWAKVIRAANIKVE